MTPPHLHRTAVVLRLVALTAMLAACLAAAVLITHAH